MTAGGLVCAFKVKGLETWMLAAILTQEKRDNGQLKPTEQDTVTRVAGSVCHELFRPFLLFAHLIALLSLFELDRLSLPSQP